jgi:hypothetical protein
MDFKTTGSKPKRQGGPKQSGVPKVKMGPLKGNKGARTVG